jgi:hypothetical protein
MTREELLAKTSSYELTEWMVYEAEEPFALPRFEVYMATVLAVLANMYRGASEPKAKVSDFLFFQKKAPAGSDAEATNRKILDMLGGSQ